MPKEMLTLYTKLFVDRGNGDENLIDLLTTPDLGIGDPEKVEVTNLQDGTRRYINGLKDVGDSLEFEFNYTTDGYEKLKEIEESKEIYTYKVVLPDNLCFEFEAALSVKIAGAAVGEQIKMTINLTPYSAIKVGQYGEDNGTSQVNEYSTFRIGAIPQTFNMRSGETTGTMNLYYNEEEPIYEVYINNEPQELPTGKINGFSSDELATVYEVKEGDIIKIRGGFSLFKTEVPLEDIVIQDGLKDCEGMFSECLGLTVAPVIPSTVTDCSYMFEDCTNLSVIPQENIDLINNPPEGLIFENCFKNCPLVADQIPTNWGGNKVEEPEEPTVEYTTFIIKSGGDIRISKDVTEPAMTELYIGGSQQELPEQPEQPGFLEYYKTYRVEEGQEVKIKGYFRLRDADIERVELQSNLTDCNHMFEGCELLIAPEIPSTVTNCESMFSGCSNLLTAPIIPSTVTNCGDMFSGCTSLTEAPVIPNSVTNCYRMFERCTSLTEAPIILEGVTNCYGMFSRCSNLLTAPIIPSTVTNCSNMFYCCTGLTEAPVIPNSVTYCNCMFEGCTNLVEAPIIPSTVTSCGDMFTDCENLTTLPSENIDLMYNHPDELEHEFCYSGCDRIIDPISYDEIPGDWK